MSTIIDKDTFIGLDYITNNIVDKIVDKLGNNNGHYNFLIIGLVIGLVIGCMMTLLYMKWNYTNSNNNNIIEKNIDEKGHVKNIGELHYHLHTPSFNSQQSRLSHEEKSQLNYIPALQRSVGMNQMYHNNILSYNNI